MKTLEPGRRSWPCTTSRPGFLLAFAAALLLASCHTPGPSKTAQPPETKPVVKLQSPTQDALAYYQLGCYYMQQGRNDKAQEALLKTLELDPNYAEAYNALGALHGRNGLLESAISAFRKGLSLSPGSPHMLTNLGYALTAAHRLPEAIETLEQAIKLEPDNIRAWTHLAQALRWAGRIEEADRALKRVAELQAKTTSLTPPSETLPPSGVQTVSLTSSGQPTLQAQADRDLNEMVQEHRPILPRGQLPSRATPLKPKVGYSRASRRYRLTVVNANGQHHLARQVREHLARQGAPTDAQVVDLPPYTQRRTVVLYSRGFEAEAARLAGQLEAPLREVPATQLQTADVRLVLGRDLLSEESAPHKALGRLATEPDLLP